MLKDFEGKGVLLLGRLSCPCGCDSTLHIRNYSRAAHYFMELGCVVYNPVKFFSNPSGNLWLRVLLCLYYFFRSDYVVLLNSRDDNSLLIKFFRYLCKLFRKELVVQDFFYNYGI